jgi:hypothetical protein
MRIISEVENSWVKPFINGMKEVNVLRLANLQVLESDVNAKRGASEDIEQELANEKRNQKLEEAKKKLEERKKLKK